MADLDRSECGLYPQVRGLTQGAPHSERFDRVVDMALGARRPRERLAQMLRALVWAIGQVGPDHRIAFGRMRGGIERLGIGVWVEWAEDNMSAT